MTTVTIYTPAGNILKQITDPKKWELDGNDRQVLRVTPKPEPNGKTVDISTTLPFIVEQWPD